MNDQQKLNIREEFRQIFSAPYEHYPQTMDLVADFFLSKIDELLKEQREELVEKGNKLKKDIRNTSGNVLNDSFYTQGIKDYQNLIKEDK